MPMPLSPCLCCQPQDAYGLEKLATEELCKHYGKDFGIETRVARFHNIYGPHGTWKGGREKAPAAFCRKVRPVHCASLCAVSCTRLYAPQVLNHACSLTLHTNAHVPCIIGVRPSCFHLRIICRNLH